MTWEKIFLPVRQWPKAYRIGQGKCQFNREFVNGLEQCCSCPLPVQPDRAWAVSPGRVKFQCPDVQARSRPIHTDSVLWLQPNVHLPNTDGRGRISLIFHYIISINWHYFVKFCFHFDIRVFCTFFSKNWNCIEQDFINYSNKWGTHSREWILFIAIVFKSLWSWTGASYKCNF